MLCSVAVLRSPACFTALLASLSQNASYGQVFSTFRQMRSASPQTPDAYTFATIAKASTELRDSRSGRAIHSLVKRLGLGSDTVLSNAMMVMYFRCGCRDEARQLFDKIPQRNVASWNALISEHVGVDDTAVCELVRECSQKVIAAEMQQLAWFLAGRYMAIL